VLDLDGERVVVGGDQFHRVPDGIAEGVERVECAERAGVSACAAAARTDGNVERDRAAGSDGRGP